MARRPRNAPASNDPTQQPEAVTGVETPLSDSTDSGIEFDPAKLETPGDTVSGVSVSETAAAKTEPKKPLGPGRAWTERYEQPVAYRRFTLKDEHGAEKILFAFYPPQGQNKPEEEVIDVMRDHKFWKHGKPNGLSEDASTDQESYFTGLKFGSNAKFPKAWVLPNNPMGREVADSIDQALAGLARRMIESHAGLRVS